MRQVTELQIRKAAMLKAARAAIRLKHMLAADAEIARELPLIEREIDEAMTDGRSLELNPAAAFVMGPR